MQCCSIHDRKLSVLALCRLLLMGGARPPTLDAQLESIVNTMVLHLLDLNQRYHLKAQEDKFDDEQCAAFYLFYSFIPQFLSNPIDPKTTTATPASTPTTSALRTTTSTTSPSTSSRRRRGTVPYYFTCFLGHFSV